MKILITGVNPVQCGHRPKLDYASWFLAVRGLAENLGHDVTFRPVVPGEDLTEFDKVILFMAPVRGFIGVHTLGALWAYLSVPEEKLIISFDDWQIKQVAISLKGLALDFDKQFEKNSFGWKHITEATPHRDTIHSVVQELQHGNWNRHTIIPCYIGGDVTKLDIPVNLNNVHCINPAAFFKGWHGYMETNSCSASQDFWILAALHDHRSWLKKQKLGWPVHEFGHKKQGQPRIPEHELVSEYAKATGILSPAYGTCGSGWWRARYGFAADVLVPIVGDPAELVMVGKSYTYLPAQVEKLEIFERLELAKVQRAEYYKAAGTLDELEITFNNLIK